MSKRKLARKRGWVEFEGLKHAKPFMSRSELVESIHAFFEERGLNIAETQAAFTVRFSRERGTRISDDGAWMSVAGLMKSRYNSSFDQVVKEVIVFVRRNQTRREFVETLFHELDHCAWVFEGKPLDNTGEYWTRPLEVRAREVGSAWSRRLGN